MLKSQKPHTDTCADKRSSTTPAEVTYDPEKETVVFDYKFDRDTEITGYMKLRLYCECRGHDNMDLFVWVKKLSLDGEYLPVHCMKEDYRGAWGYCRVSRRELDERLSTDFQPVQAHQRDLKLSEGEVVPVDVEIWPHSRFFHKGESLRVEVAGRFIRTSWHEDAKLGFHIDNAGTHVLHTGGGVTVGAHRKGRLCCVNDAVNGDGPMAPTRAGWLPATDLIRLCYSGKYTEKDLYDRVVKNGGLTDHLGTSDAREVVRRIEEGDRYAKLIYDAFIYQIAKAVGGCAMALHGKVDAIILTGGIAHDEYLVERLNSYIDWLAPVSVQAGEFEMEALAAGVIRALSGEEEVLEYTGVPVFTDFEYLKQ